MKKFWGYLNNAFTGAIAAVVVFLLQFSWWVTTPSHKVSVWLLYLIVVFLFALFALSYATVRFFVQRSAFNNRIKVVHCEVVSGRVVLVVKNCPLLSYGMAVTIYKQDFISGVESQLAVGYVENLPTGDTVQVAGLVYDSSFESSIREHKIAPSELIVVPKVDREWFST